MAQFNLAEAKARFSELVRKAMLGEEIIVAKENRPVVNIVPISPAERKPGTGQGVWISPDFDEPLEDFRAYSLDARSHRYADVPRSTGTGFSELVTATPFVKETAGGPAVSGFLHSPQSPSGDALVLAHGAGSNCRQPLLVALCEAFAAAGFFALRCDLPFRQRRATGPPSPAAAALDREGLRRAVEAVRELAAGRVILGGHSYGGRQASMLAAEDSAVADGLLLTSYPLHPPGRPDKPRTQHLPALRVPALFINGTKDPFGTAEEMQSVITLIPARTALLTIEGAGHDLAFRRGSDLPQRVLSIFTKFYSTAT